MTSIAHPLWNRLREAGIVSGELPESGEQPSPWYVRAMLGVAGWIAAVFLLGFVGAGLHFVIENEVSSLVAGLCVIGGSYGIFRWAGSRDFAVQFALATSFAGQALAAYGLYGLLTSRESLLWLVIAMLQASLALFVPNFVHRVWSAYAAAVALSMALAETGGHFVAAGLVAGAVALVWLNELQWSKIGSIMRAIGYGLTLALVQIEGSTTFGRAAFGERAIGEWAQPWVGETLAIAVFVAVVWRLLVRSGARPLGREALLALSVALLVGAVSFKASGIAVGLMIMIVGFAGGNRVLIGLGIAALLFYVSAYYYTLETTLLVKSQVLAATGAILLAARWAFTRWFFPGTEVHHA